MKLFYSILFLSILFLIQGVSVSSATQEPNHIVLEQFGEIQIREYESVVMAQVLVDGERSEASSKAFRMLFNYIQGDNSFINSLNEKQSQKIPMTAPVAQKNIGLDEWVVSFFLPPSFDLSSAPQPSDSRVLLEEFKEGQFVAIRFSGRWTDKNFKKNNKKLKKFLKKSSYQYDDTPILAYYNAPFTPGFMRRNEIMYRLK